MCKLHICMSLAGCCSVEELPAAVLCLLSHNKSMTVGCLLPLRSHTHSRLLLGQQVGPELLTGLIQVWWHVAAWAQGWELILASFIFFLHISPSSQISSASSSTSLLVSLCLSPSGGISHCLLYSPYTNWGQRMCRLCLDCRLPLCICTLLPPVPWHLLRPLSSRTQPLQTQPACSRSVSPKTPREWALTRLRWHAADYDSINKHFHYLNQTVAGSAGFSSHRTNPLCFWWPFSGHMVLFLISL